MRFSKILIGALMGGIFSTATAENFNAIVVKTTDGIENTIGLSEQLTTTFSDTEAIFSDGRTTVAFPREQLLGFDFTYLEGISQIAADPATIRPQLDGAARRIVIDNLPDGTRIAVFNAQGKRIHHATANGHHEVSLQNLPAGLYLVNIGRTTYSITLP